MNVLFSTTISFLEVTMPNVGLPVQKAYSMIDCMSDFAFVKQVSDCLIVVIKASMFNTVSFRYLVKKDTMFMYQRNI